jgi:hypothetical protein
VRAILRSTTTENKGAVLDIHQHSDAPGNGPATLLWHSNPPPVDARCDADGPDRAIETFCKRARPSTKFADASSIKPSTMAARAWRHQRGQARSSASVNVPGCRGGTAHESSAPGARTRASAASRDLLHWRDDAMRESIASGGPHPRSSSEDRSRPPAYTSHPRRLRPSLRMPRGMSSIELAMGTLVFDGIAHVDGGRRERHARHKPQVNSGIQELIHTVSPQALVE